MKIISEIMSFSYNYFLNSYSKSVEEKNVISATFGPERVHGGPRKLILTTKIDFTIS